MQLRPEARWAMRWGLRVGLLIGIPFGLLADRQPGAAPPGVALDSVVLWRLEAVVVVVAIVALMAFLVFLSWRGVLICDAFVRRGS